jgi:hypothetical protein
LKHRPPTLSLRFEVPRDDIRGLRLFENSVTRS